MAKRGRSRANKKTVLDKIFIKCPRHIKILYRELEGAEQAAKRYRKRIGSRMSVYECSVYKGWHIGHDRVHKGRKAGKKKDTFSRVK